MIDEIRTNWEVLANRWEEHYYVADARIRELEAKLEAVRAAYRTAGGKHLIPAMNWK